jgi:NRPS condensation-like uncharacterized protein
VPLAGSGAALRVDSGRKVAEHQCDTVRPGKGLRMSPEVRRALRPTEKCYWIADQMSPTNVVARVHLRGHITVGLLDRAAAALVAEHPLLRVSITTDADGTNPAFMPSTGATPIRRVNGDDLEWERQVDQHEVDTPLDSQRGPLVRIVDVALDSSDEAHDLLLTVSHIIADGTTALSLLRRLVEHADRLSVVACVDDVVKSRPVVGAPEELLPARYRGVRGMATFAAFGLADLLAATMARPRQLVPESIVGPQRRTRFVRRMLSSTQLDTLTRRCRAEGVTVHGALAAAMAMAIGPAAAQRDSGRICIGSAINVRGELCPPVSADEVGAYASIAQSILRFGRHHDLWSIARQVNRSVGRRRRFGQHLAVLYAMRFICPASVAKSSRVFGLVERHGPLNVCITNIGHYAFPARIGEWRLSGAQLVGSVSVGGFVAIVNSSHDQLFWNFLYIDGVVSDRSAQRFADGCVQTLLSAIDCPRKVAVIAGAKRPMPMPDRGFLSAGTVDM